MDTSVVRMTRQQFTRSVMDDTVVDTHVLDAGTNIFADDTVNVCDL